MTALVLNQLDERHPGITKAIGATFAEAASVCFHRHHNSPLEMEARVHSQSIVCTLEWSLPDERTLRAWANEIDTTEAGAYGVSLAALEAIDGFVAVRRAETLTGADFYVAPIGTDPDDLEDCLRLEVSGLNDGTKSAIERRLAAKLDQASNGNSNLPAVAAVIGFKESLLVMALLGVK